MAEALAAVALAGNVLQFFEAVTGFTANASRICRSQSAGEASSNLKDLRGVVSDLQGLLMKLHPQDALSSEPRIDLASLSRNCANTVQELLTKLDSIGLGRQGRGDLLLAEFRAMWNSQAIQELETRVMRFRDQLAFHLVVTVRDLATQSLAQQDVILSELRRLGNHLGNTQPRNGSGRESMSAPGSFFIRTLSVYLSGPGENNEQQLHLLRSAMYANITAPRDDDKKIRADFKLPDDVRHGLQREFISKFHYEEREHRKFNIRSPHNETFKWIFPNGSLHKKTTFSKWLQSDGALFWITGKAGSGKSTLMKYISEPQDDQGETLCHPYLKQWAGRARLLSASFYFWASGTAMERSQDALFKSLLHQIFRRSPGIIPRVAPSHWESLCLLGPPLSVNWSGEGLQQVFLHAFREVVAAGNKICLFIDGLDEFDGDLTVLISTIYKVSKMSNMKVCVSSRPWEEFEQAFGEKPSLRVQDLTLPDIQRYVKDHFNRNTGFKRLQDREPDFAGSLLNEIVEKSAGVFLWVKLVVTTLLAGLSNDDRVSDLKRRLDNLPPELERIYANILGNIDPFYYEHACQYFNFVMTCDGSPDALLTAYADEDLDSAVEIPVHTLRAAEKQLLLETLRRRLNSRCKGLLEIGVGDRVNFLHRTAKDYFASAEAGEQIEKALVKSKYDPYLQLCSAHFCMLKTNGNLQRRPVVANGWLNFSDSTLEACLEAASQITQQRWLAIPILDSLRKVLLASGYSPMYCTIIPSQTRKFVRGNENYVGNSFLALAARFGLAYYLDAKVPAGACCKLTPRSGSRTLSLASSKSRTHEIATRMRRIIQGGLRSRKHDTGEAAHEAVAARAPHSQLLRTGEVDSEAGEWPLLIAACFTNPPNVEVFRTLLERGAKCGAPWNFGNTDFEFVGVGTLGFGKYQSVLSVILGIAVLSICVVDAEHKTRLRCWKKIVQLLRSHGALAAYQSEEVSAEVLGQIWKDKSTARYHSGKTLDQVLTELLWE
ncbi:hypothetical protein B0T14DRAFT_451650 [Immersiella caudata]|uniref:NACHT domain-containing protein n=1 Tax=Immersiella caudata TaxID=314043 RepID=A0AA39WVV1_9PEZI|nr:hypothetical protein B0T14DRAFT_451650 [Immersiella caudata]